MQAETPEARLMRAAAFAAEVHTRQRRKGAAQEPYAVSYTHLTLPTTERV